tara:strand:- start:10662 stop:10865 length:204 start_codon:yes stop_codon:yes gene_type:complete
MIKRLVKLFQNQRGTKGNDATKLNVQQPLNQGMGLAVMIGVLAMLKRNPIVTPVTVNHGRRTLVVVR